MNLRHMRFMFVFCLMTVQVYIAAIKKSDAAYERKLRLAGRAERQEERVRARDEKQIEALEVKAKKEETLAAQAFAAQKKAQTEKEAYRYLERGRKFEQNARKLRMQQEELTKKWAQVK